MTANTAPAPGAATVTSHSTGTPIPFRKTAAASGPEVFGVLVTTLLVLAAFAILATYARKRGWLDRWVGSLPSAANTQRKLAVIETLRVSRKTTLYRVSHGEREFLLAESSASLQLSPAGIESDFQP